MKRMTMAGAAALACLLIGGQARAQTVPDRQTMIRQAIQKSVPVMLDSGASFQQRMGKVCFSCHHQSLPAAAYAAARQAGMAFDEKRVQGQSDYVYSFIARAEPLLARAVEQKDAAAERELDHMMVDPAISVDYALFGLDQDGRKPDRLLGLAAAYLAKKQAEDGRWPVHFARPPLEGSEVTATALAVNALRRYAPAEAAADIEQRVARARTWLLAAAPRTMEEKSFRLLGLKWSGAPEEEIRKAARALLDEQRDDGGWPQLAGRESDAYATGQALVALRRGAGMAAESAYSRGVFFLVGTQRPDGSWLVTKRSPAFQPFFETSFPNGPSQFISISGTAWATTALALAVEPPARSASR